MKGKEQKLIVASAYLPYDRSVMPPSSEFRDLVNYSKADNIPLLIGCDANAHHLVWGSTDCNPQGESLLDYLLTSNLVTLNTNSEPTFVTSTRQEVIDISISSIHVAHLFKQWRVTNKVLLSDHRCITFYMETDYVKVQEP